MKTCTTIIVISLMTVPAVLAGDNTQIKKIPYVTVFSENGYQYPGRILDVNDSSLVLWCNKEPYDERNHEEYAKQFHYGEIRQIVIERKGHIYRGILVGSLIGTTTYMARSVLVPVDWTNEEWSPFEIAEGMLSAPLFLIGGVVGGVVGALQGVDDKVQIDRDRDLYHDAVPELTKVVMPVGTTGQEDSNWLASDAKKENE